MVDIPTNAEGDDTPTESQTPTATLPQDNTEANALKEQIRRLEQRQTELATTNRSLEERLSEIGKKPILNDIHNPTFDEVEQDLETDPAKGVKKLARVVKNLEQKYSQDKENIIRTAREESSQSIARASYVSKLYTEKPDLKPYDEFLGASVNILMEQTNPKTGRKYQFVEATEEAIDKLQKARASEKKPAKEEKIPSEAKAETGASKNPPPPPEEKDETVADVVSKRKNLQYQKRFGSKQK